MCHDPRGTTHDPPASTDDRGNWNGHGVAIPVVISFITELTDEFNNPLFAFTVRHRPRFPRTHPFPILTHLSSFGMICVRLIALSVRFPSSGIALVTRATNPTIPAGCTRNSRGRTAHWRDRLWIVHFRGTPVGRCDAVALLTPDDDYLNMRRKRWVHAREIEMTDDPPISLPAFVLKVKVPT